MSNLAEFKNKSQEQMIEYAVRMRKARDERGIIIDQLAAEVARQQGLIQDIEYIAAHADAMTTSELQEAILGALEDARRKDGKTKEEAAAS